MRSASGGPLTAFFLFAVLLGVPLLAIFGVPHFAPVVASPGDEPEFGSDVEFGRLQETSLHGPESAFPAQASRFAEPPPTSPAAAREEPQFDGTWHDPFSSAPESLPVEQPGFSGPFAEGRPPASTDQPHPARLNWNSEPPRTAEIARASDVRANFDEIRRPGAPRDVVSPPQQPDAFYGARATAAAPLHSRGNAAVSADRFPDFSESRPPAAAADAQAAATATPGPFTLPSGAGALPPLGASAAEPSSHQALTWRGAVARLNELGIRQFKLEPGARDGFHFSCYFAPPDNPRVTHRFEAEATEPLRAVENVLTQVEAWLRGQ